MKRVMHFDRIELKIDRSTIRKLPGGAVLVDGIAARTGLYTYHDETGAPFVELVPASTLFAQASMDSMAAAPFTIRHTDGLVDPETFQASTHGAVVKAWQASDTELGVRVRIGSADGLKALTDGMIELSPGYEVDVTASPGVSEFGRHDGVQAGRDYDHLAGLWAGEARGGPGMRLQLDGPVCAPPGCRIQSHRARQSGPPESPHMFKLTNSDGKTVQLASSLAGWLRAAAQINTDQIETVSITAALEGGETTELTLPLAMWEMMLEGIGAAASAPAAAPEGMEPSEVEVEQLEALDADPEKDGALTLDAIASLIDRKLGAHTKQQRQLDARDSEVMAAARRLNIDTADSRHWADVAVDAIVKADPNAETRARKLATDAKGGSLVAEGRLRELLNGHADAAGTPGEMVRGEVIKHERPKPREDARSPWERGVPNKKAPDAKEKN